MKMLIMPVKVQISYSTMKQHSPKCEMISKKRKRIYVHPEYKILKVSNGNPCRIGPASIQDMCTTVITDAPAPFGALASVITKVYIIYNNTFASTNLIRIVLIYMLL